MCSACEECTGFCGFCPFFYSWTGEEYVFDTQILYTVEGKENETTQARNISHLSTEGIIKGMIKEEEPETSYIDSVTLEVTDASEQESITYFLKPTYADRDLEKILYSDDDYMITKFGDEIAVEFEDAPDLPFGNSRRVRIIAEKDRFLAIGR